MNLKELKEATKKFIQAERNYKEYRDKVLGPVSINRVVKMPIRLITKEQIARITNLHKVSDAAEKEMQKAKVEFINKRVK